MRTKITLLTHFQDESDKPIFQYEGIYELLDGEIYEQIGHMKMSVPLAGGLDGVRPNLLAGTKGGSHANRFLEALAKLHFLHGESSESLFLHLAEAVENHLKRKPNERFRDV